MVVYCATNLVNGKVYIGKHEGICVEYRWNQHLADAGRGYGWSPHFYNAIRKYGSQAFKFEILYAAKSTKELRHMETFFIVLHQSHLRKNGYNLTMGGDGGVPTQETRNKISTAMTGRFPREHYVALGKSGKGKRRSLESCARIKASKRGYKPAKSGNMVVWTPERRAIQAARLQVQRASGHDPRLTRGANAPSV